MSAASSSRRSRLDEVVPIENAAMEERTIIEWDKDDLDALGILKVDVLGARHADLPAQGFELLRSITASLRRFRTRRGGATDQGYDLATVPTKSRRSTTCCSAPTRSACSRSRAARRCRCCRGCKPKEFYDLVIEVAIVRPGPIQGDMVHPYLRRRQGHRAGRLSVKPELEADSRARRSACRCSRNRR